MHKLIPILLLCLCGSAAAQVRIAAYPAGLVPLFDGWRMHSGDNPAWANPAFDDSSWQPASFSFAKFKTPQAHEVWYRLHLELPASDSPIAMSVLVEDGLTELYVNGQRSSELSMLPWWAVTAVKEHVVPLPPKTRSVVLALRFVAPPFDNIGITGRAQLIIGSANDIRRYNTLILHRRLIAFLPSAAINLALAIAGIGLLLLFATQRRSPEYLWLGIYLFLLGSSFGLFSAVNARIVPGSVNDLYSDPAIFLFTIAQIEFTYTFILRKPSRIWRVYEGLLLLAPVLTVVNLAGGIHGTTYWVAESILVLPAACALPITLLYWYRRGSREAGWLIVPSLFPAAGVIYTNLSTVVALMHVDLNLTRAPVTLWGAVPINGYDIAGAIFLLAIGVVMFFRFSHVSRDQARSIAELEAAREIQQRLVPIQLPETPGLQIEAVYLPATQVGGDFYQILEQADDSTLVVLGDVSGKGLKAAMTGALAIGAIRTLAAETIRPALFMERLNRQIVAAQNTGFITCICAHISASGQVTLANAGHLAPYRNGNEEACEGSLPLGLYLDAKYPETILQLAAGDTLALLTDGVLEAQSAQGELLGFDRMAALTRKPASEIAKAAQQWGQDDDITVLTVTRQAKTA